MKRFFKRTLAVLITIIMFIGIAPISRINSFAAAAEDDVALLGYKTGDIIEFGSYPQTRVKDNDLIAKLDKETKEWKSYKYYSGSGNYSDGKMRASDYMEYADFELKSDNKVNKYRAVRFSKYRPKSTGCLPNASESFQDENGYTINNTYYFAFEKLKWRVLDAETGLVMSNYIIDNQAFNNYMEWGYRGFYWGDSHENYMASYYRESSIRKWLGEDFYNNSFSSSEKDNIKDTLVDNINYADNESYETKDKIFLLSVNDVQNREYSFSTEAKDYDEARQLTCTDYAECQGACIEANCSGWWLRTQINSRYVDSVDSHGVTSIGYRETNLNICANELLGVVPAMRITLKHGFSLSDGWGFANTDAAFGRSDYYIPEERYEEVFGKAYVDNVNISNDWNGNCFGMCAAAALLYQGKLDLSDYSSKDYDSLNEYYDSIKTDGGKYLTAGRDSEITKLIERYQLFQLSKNDYFINNSSNSFLGKEGVYCNTISDSIKYSDFKETSLYLTLKDQLSSIEKWSEFAERDIDNCCFYAEEHNPNGEYVRTMLEKIKKSDIPLGVLIQDHMMLTRTDVNRDPEPDKDGWYKIYLYDPNHPLMPEKYAKNSNLAFYYSNNNEKYLELNPDQNKWRYFGETNADGDGKYYGCDENGNVIYEIEKGKGQLSDIDTASKVPAEKNQIIKQIVTYGFALVDFSNLPTTFNGSLPWQAKDGKVYISLPGLAQDGKSASFTLYDTNNEIVAQRTNDEFYYSRSAIFNDINAAEGSTSEQGTLILPGNEYKVVLEGGSLDIIGSKGVLTISADKPTVFEINGDLNSMNITADQNTKVSAKVAEIISNDKYATAYIDGEMAANEKVSLSVNNQTVSAHSSNSKTDLDISVKTETMSSKKEIGNINEGNNINIRNCAGQVKSVSVSDIKLNYKKSTTLKPTITADEGVKYTVRYESSNPKVATVDENGKVYGAKKGSTEIKVTVTDSNGNTVTDTCKVTVKYSFGQWLIKILLFGWIWY